MSDRPYTLKREGKNRRVFVGGVQVGWVRKVDHNRRGMVGGGQRNGWVAMVGGDDLREDQSSGWPPYPLRRTDLGHGWAWLTLGEAAMAVYRYAVMQ